MTRITPSLTRYTRRTTQEVRIGCVRIGGGNRIAVQSMTNTDTNDTEACLTQIAEIVAAGGHIVRLTAQGRREGENLKNIAVRVNPAQVALVADIHFTPEVAMIAAESVDKVRINPGNYRDPDGRLFRDLIALCRSHGVAIRIGVNHGSLAADIVDELGDTPQGMVESAMRFLRVCREEDFTQAVVSMKSSNVRVMVYTYRLLVEAMAREGMDFPLHLGVTEAGNGMEGRVKSSVGIGSLLADGIGDTIRVSLTEPPQNEIPVAIQLVRHFEDRETHEAIEAIENESLYSPTEYIRRESKAVGRLGGQNVPLLWSEMNEPEREGAAVIVSTGINPVADWRARILNMMARGDMRPVVLHRRYRETSLEALQIKAAADFGPLFIDGLADGLYIENEGAGTAEEIHALGLAILQSSRMRMTKTEYIACPGCGRTLYELEKTLADIKARTSHLAGLKIGVMGCIVNGPGEMADADYGYVGSGKGLITLYKGKTVVRRGIPQSKAINALISLIKENGDWRDE